MTEMYRQSNGYGDQRLFKVWAEHSGEAIDWYGDLLEKTVCACVMKSMTTAKQSAIRFTMSAIRCR